MVFTDPPYNVQIDGHASGLGAIHHRPFPMASGEMDKAEFTAFLTPGLPQPRRVQQRRIDCTTSAWTGAISTSCWPPATAPMAN